VPKASKNLANGFAKLSSAHGVPESHYWYLTWAMFVGLGGDFTDVSFLPQEQN